MGQRLASRLASGWGRCSGAGRGAGLKLERVEFPASSHVVAYVVAPRPGPKVLPKGNEAASNLLMAGHKF